jgi:hypothetical protein
LSCYFLIGALAVVCLGCRGGPAFNDDSAYRALEREADRNSADLAVTGSNLEAGAERAAGHAERVASELDSLGASIAGSRLEDPEKGALLRQVAVAQGDAEALRGEVNALRINAGLLNKQLAEQREISAARSEEHDRREAAAAALESELATKTLEAEEYKGRGNSRLVIIIALAGSWALYIAYRVCKFLKIIPA